MVPSVSDTLLLTGNVPDETAFDDAWEAAAIPRLPFPIAFVLARVRQEATPWDILVKDTLSILLRYVALLGVSEYLSDPSEPDFDVNDELKNISRVMSEGQWLRLARSCAARKTAERPFPELAAAILRIETDRSMAVGAKFERYGLNTDRQGLFSILITIRNKLFAHGVTLDAEEKAQVSSQVRRLVRAVIYELEPVWEYRLCVPVGGQESRHYLELHGTQDFREVARPDGVRPGDAFVNLPNGRIVALHPCTLVERVKTARYGALLDQSAELYLLNYLERAKVPVYTGLSGGCPRRPDLSDDVQAIFDRKRVWMSRQDIELEQVLQYTVRRTRESLEYFEWNNLYNPDRYIERPSLQPALSAFLDDETSRVLFITGGTGSGKTATTIHWIRRMIEDGVPVRMLRAVELPPEDTATPLRMARFLSALHGYGGPFEEILHHAASSPSGRFVLVIDGLNEFLAKGRDLDTLWRTLNALVEQYAHIAAFKMVLTTRTESDDPAAFFPRGEPPVFAQADAFFRVEGRPWFTIPPLSTEEIAALLERYGFDSAVARRSAEKHQRVLSNANLAARYAEGVLGGADIRRMDRNGITVAFAYGCLSRDRTLRNALDGLTAILGKNRQFEMPLDAIATADPKLAEMLNANNHRILNRLRELGLVCIERTHDEEGLPATTLSLGNDTLFEVLRARRERKISVFNLARLWGTIATFILIVMLVISTGVKKIARMEFERRTISINSFYGAQREAQGVEPDTIKRLESLRLCTLDHLENLVDAVSGYLTDYIKCLAYSLEALVFLCFAVVLVLTEFPKWLWRRRRVDARLKYLSWKMEREAVRPIVDCLWIAMVVLIIVTLVLAIWHFFLDSPQPFKILLWPALVLLAFIAVFGLLLVSANAHRIASRSGSDMLMTWWYSRKEVVVSLQHGLLYCGNLVLCLTLIYFAVGLSPRQIGWHAEQMDRSADAVDAALSQHVTLQAEIAEATGVHDFISIPMTQCPRLGDSPFVSADNHARLLRFLLVALALFGIGFLLATGFQIAVSRRTFPEQWGKT